MMVEAIPGPDAYDELSAGRPLFLTLMAWPDLLGENGWSVGFDLNTAYSRKLALAMTPPISASSVTLIGDVVDVVPVLPQELFGSSYPGRTLHIVSVPTDAGVEAVARVIRGVPGAAEADVFVTVGTFGAWCTHVPWALDLLDAPGVLVQDGGCLFEPDAEDLQRDEGLDPAALDGVYAASTGVNPIDPDANGFDVFNYATAAVDVERRAYRVYEAFSLLMTTVRVMNEVEDPFHPAEVRALLESLTEPTLLHYGSLGCTRITFMGVYVERACLQYSGVFQHLDGSWTAVADGSNGKLLSDQGIVDAE